MNDSVLLVNPSFDLEAHFGKLAKVGPSLLPVGSAYLASMLEAAGMSAAIWDGQVEPAGLASLETELRTLKPAVIGITVYSPMLAQTRAVVDLVRRELPNARIVAGGIHPTVLPEEILDIPGIDVVVRGEAEPIIVQLCQNLIRDVSVETIAGTSIRRDGAVSHAADIPLIDSLDTIPPPARHLLKNERYRPAPEITLANPKKIQSLITSRGCPYQCIFCSARLLSGRRYRFHSPERILTDVEDLVRTYGAEEVVFLDDNFTVNRSRLVRTCDLLRESGLARRLIWACNARVDEVDREVLGLMRASGCRLISFGVESGVPRILTLIKKGITVEQSRNAVGWAHDAGIRVRMTLILGLPTETEADTKATVDFAKSLRADFAKFSLATPYPGTELCQIAEEMGLMASHDWSRASSMVGFSSYDPLFVPEGRTGEEMKRWQRRAMRQFYLRPRQIWSILSQTKTTADARLLIQAALAVL
ncbi:cobalamin-dependent protein, partial [Candidatus Fermentibacteria bacterium]|nr:cobalamin-dependent protein [Candidatus Fermentibacteria bacterium]